MTLKEFLKMNINIRGITIVIINSKKVLKRCDINNIPKDLINKKVIGWAVEQEYQIIIEIGEEVMDKNTELKIQFKKRTDYTWEVWTDDEDGGDYIREIKVDDIHILCTQIESENTILNMAPSDFTSLVWSLCVYKIFDNYNSFNYYSDNFKSFSKWFDDEVINWYCEMVKGLI